MTELPQTSTNGLFRFDASPIVMTAVGALSAYIAFVVAPPMTQYVLGNYHVVADVCLALLLYGLLSALFVRTCLLIRPLRCGEFGLDSPETNYWRLLFFVTFVGLGAVKPFNRFLVSGLFARLFGGTVGKGVAFGCTVTDPFMIEVGNNAVLGWGSLLTGNVINDNRVTVGRIKIGNNVTIGMNVVVFPDVEIGDNAVVALNSVVAQGTRIPAGETWRGNPARKWQ